MNHFALVWTCRQLFKFEQNLLCHVTKIHSPQIIQKDLSNTLWIDDVYMFDQHCIRTLQWRHNDHDGVSNHQPNHCLLNLLFGCRLKKTSKLRVTGLCAGNSPVNSPHKWPVTRKMFPWWHHHDTLQRNFTEPFSFNWFIWKYSLQNIDRFSGPNAFNIVCYPAVFLTQLLLVYCVVCLQGNWLGWMGDDVVSAQIRSWLVWAKLLYPPLQRSWKGGTLVSPCPSVRLWTEWCPLCIFNNTHRIYFIFAHLINQLQKVCDV